MGDSILEAQFRNLLAGSDEAFKAFFTSRPQLLDSLIVSPTASMTPLAYASLMACANVGTISSGSLSKFKYLLSTKKVDVNGRKPRSDAEAAEYNPLCIGLLSFLQYEDEPGVRPMLIARTLEVFELLLQAGANLNIVLWPASPQKYPWGERTLFMCACVYIVPEIITILLRYKARVNEANSKGITPLMFTLTNNAYGYASETMGPDIKKSIEILLNAGAFIDSQDEEGKTALMYAVLQRNPDAVKLLIQKGANISLKTRTGQTAFDLATPEVKAQLKPFFKDLLVANEFRGEQSLPPDVTSLVGTYVGAPSKPARQPPNTAQQKQTVLGQLKATPPISSFPGGTDYQSALGRNPQGGRRTRKARKHKKKRKYTRK